MGLVTYWLASVLPYLVTAAALWLVGKGRRRPWLRSLAVLLALWPFVNFALGYVIAAHVSRRTGGAAHLPWALFDWVRAVVEWTTFLRDGMSLALQTAAVTAVALAVGKPPRRRGFPCDAPAETAADATSCESAGGS